MFDLIIRGGTIVDGTGAPRRTADLGIKDGRIAALGKISEAAARTIDAQGQVIAPGFVDIHTHYDAQIMWDPLAAPSSLHGFTTIIGGNCGFTIAPMAMEHADYLTRMLSRVEGIPLISLQKALDFNWRSFGEWLARMDGNVGINVGFLVGHSTLRRLVMGKDAVFGQPDETQLQKMCDMLDQSIAEGGMGFSSSWATAQTDGDDNPVPSRAAKSAEIIRLAAVAGRRPGTTLEFGPKNAGNFDEELLDLMIAMSAAANRPVNWNDVRVRTASASAVEAQLAHGAAAQKQGARIMALSMPLPSHLQVTLGQPFVFDLLPGWVDTMKLPLPERMRVLRDPAARKRLDHDAQAITRAPFNTLVKWAGLRFAETYTPANESLMGRTVGEVAAERGQNPFDTLLDVSLSEDLRTYVAIPPDNDDDATWALRRKVWRDPRALIGGSDAGAHVDALCNSRYGTALVGPLVRDRGLLSLEEAVHLITDVPSRFYGLRQRGRIQEGWHADLVIFDPATVGPGPIRVKTEFPGNAPHLSANANGVAHVIVNGVEILHNGSATGDLPGRVLRSNRDIDTVTARTVQA